MFAQYFLFLTALLGSVFALPLAKRDVVSPPITSPTNGTVWYVGDTQTVTWDTSNLPTQQTNPVGKLILGYWYNNSENLNLDSPLATGLNYSVGKAQIKVPDVPTRSDYIVVLFGDSGNASPQFTINSPSSSTTSSSSSSPPGSSPPAASTPASNPSPASPDSPGSSAGGTSPTLVNGSSGPAGAGAVLTSTAASSTQTVASSSSTVVIATASASSSSTQSNAAWQKRTPSLGTSLGVLLAILCFVFS